MTLVLLELNLCLVTTVLFQEIPTVKFGFRTSGDYILLEFVLRDVETKLSLSTYSLVIFVFSKSLSSFNDDVVKNSSTNGSLLNGKKIKKDEVSDCIIANLKPWQKKNYQ